MTVVLLIVGYLGLLTAALLLIGTLTGRDNPPN
jgi:hypothetical protein